MNKKKYLKKNFGHVRRKLDRNYLEVNHLRKFKTPNNNNWRNAFITLSVMGLISEKNNLSQKGLELSTTDFPEFCAMIFYDYCKPYVDEIFKILNKLLYKFATSFSSFFSCNLQLKL